MDSVLNSVSSTGQFFVTFRTIEDKIVVMNSRDSYGGTSISECTIDPDKVIWENIGLESGLRRRMLLVPLMIILLIVFWSLVFFVPYALYTLHASMSHLMEIIVLGLYVEFGNSLVSVVLNRVVRDMGFVDRDAMDGFIMWSNYIIKLVNIGLNVLLAHFNNYGKSSKVRVMVENMDLYYSSASYKTGEEISFSNSFGTYLMDILILPNFVFIFTYYILPLINSFFILTLDFSINEAVAVLEFPIVDLAKKYGDSLINFTVFLFLLFLVKDKRQSLYVSLTLLISYITHYFQCKFVILRKSSVGHYPTWHLEHAALIIWGFPTMVLAILPSYWNWRYKGGVWRFLKIISSAILHLIFYNILIHFTFGTYTSLKQNDDEITKIQYKAGTYNIDNIDAIGEANASVKSKSYADFNPICNMKELKKLNLF